MDETDSGPRPNRRTPTSYFQKRLLPKVIGSRLGFLLPVLHFASCTSKNPNKPNYPSTQPPNTIVSHLHPTPLLHANTSSQHHRRWPWCMEEGMMDLGWQKEVGNVTPFRKGYSKKILSYFQNSFFQKHVNINLKLGV